jgi:hypothetical protein
VAVSPNQLKNLRGRYGPADNKDDGSTRSHRLRAHYLKIAFLVRSA